MTACRQFIFLHLCSQMQYLSRKKDRERKFSVLFLSVSNLFYFISKTVLKSTALNGWCFYLATPNGLGFIKVSLGQTLASNAHPRCILFFESVLPDSKKETTRMGGFFFGDPERTRTVDLQRDRLAC